MVRTKQRHDSEPESPQPSKKNRTEWTSQDCIPTPLDCETSITNSESSSQVYPIKGILGENLTKYLIDWADNSQTGEIYSPSWQLKANVSKQAIAAWHSKLAPDDSTESSDTTAYEDYSDYASPSIYLVRRERSRRNARRILSSSPIDDSCGSSRLRETDSAPSSSLINRPAFVVKISQHSSLDKSQYQPIILDLSTQSNYSSLPHDDSGLGESSHPSSPITPRIFPKLFVPDSQSLLYSSEVSSHFSTSATRHRESAGIKKEHSITEEATPLQSSLDKLVVPDSIEGTIDTPSIVYAGIQSQSSSLPSLNELLIEYRARSRGFETRSNSQSPAVSGSHSNPERARTYRTNPEKACEPGSMESIIKDTQQDRIESASESSAHRPSSYNSQGSVSLQSYQSAELSEQEPTSQTSARPVSNPNKMDKSTYSLKRSTLPRSQNRQSALSDDHKPIDEETAMLRTQNHHAATSSVRETAKPIPGISSNPSYRYAPPGLFATSPLYELLTNPHAEPRRASYGGVQPSMTQTLEEENIEPRRRASSTDVKYIGTEIVDKDQQVAPPALGDDQSRLEVQDMTVPVELPLPVRLPPHDDGSTLQMNTSSSDEENGTLASTSMLYPVDLGKMQFVIPLNVIPSTRDQYVSTINYYRRHIQCLMQEAVPNQETVDKIKQMLSRASDATTHIDLLHESDDPSQQMVDPVEEAAWAISNSQKFQFLQELFQALLRASKPCHLAIVAKQGKSMGILEMFLRGKKITYHRFDTNTRSPLEVQECVEVALMPSGSGGSHFRALRNDLVIAFDGSFNADDEQVKALRTLTYSVRLSPVVHLLIHNSVEHIEHCIPQNANDTHRLRMIVGYILTLKKEVGKGDPNDFTTEEQAQMVAKYVHTPREDREWQLPSIRPIEEIEFLESQAESPPEKTSQEIRGSGGLKRSLELDIDSSASPKRQRVTPAAEVTHISDSVATQSQTTIESLTRSLQSAELATSQQSQRADRALVDYQKTRTMLEEHIAALSALQYQYESRSRLIAQMRDNNKDLTASLENAKFKVQSLMDELAINKEARKNLEVDLKEARLQLANSSNPAVQELAEATLARVKAEESLQKVQKKYDLSLKDLDFTRQQYQTASTSAVEISANANALERQVAELTYKADARVIQLQERNQATASARLQARVRELEQIISQRDSMLRRKEEEVRDLGRRGRGMQTRGTSVTPASATGRSPKANASSRGVSPATETSVIVNNPRFLAPTAAPMERTGSGRGRGRGAGAGAAGGDRGTGQSGRSTPVPTTGHRRQISGNGNTRSVGGGVPMVRTGSGLRRQIGDDDDGRQ